MQLLKLVFIAALALILAVGHVSAAPQPLEGSVIESRDDTLISAGLEMRDEPETLVKRQCDPNGCRCQVGVRSDTYCGYCRNAVINQGRAQNGLDAGDGSIYQCNRNGDCCNFGRNNDCIRNLLSCA